MKLFIYKIISKLRDIWERFETARENEVLIQKIQRTKGKIGNGCSFGKNVMISGTHNLKMGNNVHIGSNAFIRADGGLSIGNNTIFSRNTVLYTINHDYEGKRLPFDEKMIKKPVKIEDNVWIGMNVTIAPGTYIGEGSIIGLGARISGRIPKFSIIGTPNIKIKERDKNHYEKLKLENSFGNDDGYPIKN